MKWHEVRDPVHGFINFNDIEKDLINHPVFQRLRRIKQLALTEMVYPGATHTRFEHSLGVMHIASRMFDSIVKSEKNKDILKKTYSLDTRGLETVRQTIRLAALLHDVGHGPFSHGGEELFPINTQLIDKNPESDNKYKHEDYSVALIRGPLKEVIENNQYNRSNFKIYASEIADLIEGRPNRLEQIFFWRTLISSQLDADRADYLLRDSHHIGVKYGVFDLERLLGTMTLGNDPETDDVVIGIHEDGWHNAESLIIARYQFFSQVAYHHVRRAYDIMLEKALLDTVGEYPPPDTEDSLNEYIKLDDPRVWARMLESDAPACKMLLARKHLKYVHQIEDANINSDNGELKRVIQVLEDAGIPHNVDNKENEWYKFQGDVGMSDQIHIITKDGTAVPLSQYSKIIDSLKPSRQVRVYVGYDYENRARELIGGNNA
ncbi:HD domain-containing protein [Methanoculleus sp. MH98A]|uniref:HD domain-containing protein n=1 Tax=Methanoculleus sp. MH98A TaxID=1495314 RepID=UPI00064E549B|nr:HD domain-containing protein [Methanoculleus sp. MH98A]